MLPLAHCSQFHPQPLSNVPKIAARNDSIELGEQWHASPACSSTTSTSSASNPNNGNVSRAPPTVATAAAENGYAGRHTTVTAIITEEEERSCQAPAEWEGVQTVHRPKRVRLPSLGADSNMSFSHNDSSIPQQPRNSLNSEIAQSTSFTNDTQKRQSSSAFTAVSEASSFQCDNSPFSAEDRAYYELEQALQYPVLPPNPHFFCCFDRFHITAISKVLCLIYVIFYGFLCYLSYDPNHAAAFLISFLVAISVGCCLVYAVFQWSKMCLMPFFLLQVILIMYTMVWMVFVVYAALSPGDSYVFKEMHQTFDNWMGICTQLWCWIILAALAIFFAFLAYSALLFWYEYQFIAEVDHFLKSIRKSSSNVSKDDHQTQNGASRLQL